METYLERYYNGEREAVWRDLIELGSSVYQEPIHADALAVARETMSRARANIEKLIVRLDGLGYRFQTARDTPQAMVERIADIHRAAAAALAAQFPVLQGMSKSEEQLQDLLAGFDKSLAPASTLDEKSVYSRAQELSPGCVADLEKFMQGPMPLSLRAWFECIGHVSLIGSHPELNPAGPDHDITRNALPDPLAMMGLPDRVDFESWDSDEGYPIAVDEFFKANIHREERYHINFRDARADTIFRDWRSGYFVCYLRRVFEWGGFPGWERHPKPPMKLIAELTEGLLKI